AVSLAAGTKEIMSLRAGASMPEIIQLRLNGQRSDRSSSRPEIVKATAVVESDDVVLANRIAADQQVMPLNADPIPFVDTDDDLLVQSGALVWGHWFSVPTGDTCPIHNHRGSTDHHCGNTNGFCPKRIG
ncbi:hypothetical protein N9K86_02150, partial [Litoricolaceae bacterium]|nr:hypothetical protein [Litorivicinaceae bacterium]